MTKPSSKSPPACLIATLGTEPQVVTAVLDLLFSEGETVQIVNILHTTAPGTAIEQAVKILHAALTVPPYPTSLQVRFTMLTDSEGCLLSDVDTPRAAQAAFSHLYNQVRQAKLAGQRVHLSIAGGRKTMSVFAMTAAQLLFDEQDCLWHLYSGGEFLQSKRLHPQPGDQVHLIAVPVILWNQLVPAAWTLDQIADPYQAIERIRALQLHEKTESIRGFVFGSLTPAERRVIELLAREGLSDQELAARLNLSARTVEQHLRSAYNKAAVYWELGQVNRAQLISLLNLYYTTEITEKYA